MPRDLSAEERALWWRVTADLRGGQAKPPAPELHGGPLPPPVRAAPRKNPSVRPAQTLDASWDRRLSSGSLAADRVVDLHGLTAAAAHARALSAIEAALDAGERIVVLVTGKPPPPATSRLDQPLRGIIRASIGDWLAASPVADGIAAIRPAHRRHGGAGAIYVVLRRVAPRIPKKF